MKPKLLVLLFLVLCVLLASSCAGWMIRRTEVYGKLFVEPPPKATAGRAGWVQTIGEGADRITVVYLEGSHYEMGRRYGELLGAQVRACMRGVLDGWRVEVGESMPKPLPRGWLTGSLLDEAYALMEPYIPAEYKDEMRGLAEGSGVSLTDIHRVHAIPGITETSCSAFAAFGTATPDGSLYQLRILDYIMDFGIQDYPVIAVYRPDRGNAYVSIGWAGFVGVVSGMNGEGVAVSEMGMGDAPDETLRGMPMIFLFKRILQYADNVEQATGIIRSAQRTNYYAFVVGDGIREPGELPARGFLTSRDTFRAFEANAPDSPVPPLPDIIYGSHDSEKCRRLLKDNHGGITPELTMQLINPAIAMKSNLQCVMYDPGNLSFWVANAAGRQRACERNYVYFDMRAALQ